MNLKVTVEEAQQILLDNIVEPMETEVVTLMTALGRITATDITAKHQLPLFSKSPLDGYAMRAEDIQAATRNNPIILDVIEEYGAGYAPQKVITKGLASKLMTGAPMPEGANIVIKYEDIERVNQKIKVFYPLQPNSNVIFAGEDIKSGECIVKKGEQITPARIGVLASVGINQLTVRRKIRVALITTGDEIINPSDKLTIGKIFNSNLPTLWAAIQKLGAEVIVVNSVADNKAKINKALQAALVKADIVITTGGVSVGDYDFIPDCVKEIGAEILFKGVCLKPGSPALAARFKDKIILSLSGNAAAAAITFQLLAVPLLKKMMGIKDYLFLKTKAMMMNDFVKSSPQRRFLRGKFVIDIDKNKIYLNGSQSNGAIKSLIDCNALIDIPAGSESVCTGQEVDVLLTGQF